MCTPRASVCISSSVAWGSRLTDPQGGPASESGGKAPPGTQYFELSVYEEHGVTFGMSRLRPFQNYTPAGPPNVNPSPEAVARRWERALLLPWLDGKRPWPDPKKGDAVWVKASGWPLRSFWCELHSTNAPNFATHTWSAPGGLILSNPVRPGWGDWPPNFPIIIPLRPIWPEMLASTAIYGVAWAALLTPFPLVRRALRVRRGRCPVCAYDLSGLGQDVACPECGLART